jgi:hypothetical protein
MLTEAALPATPLHFDTLFAEHELPERARRWVG